MYEYRAFKLNFYIGKNVSVKHYGYLTYILYEYITMYSNRISKVIQII